MSIIEETLYRLQKKREKPAEKSDSPATAAGPVAAEVFPWKLGKKPGGKKVGLLSALFVLAVAMSAAVLWIGQGLVEFKPALSPLADKAAPAPRPPAPTTPPPSTPEDARSGPAAAPPPSPAKGAKPEEGTQLVEDAEPADSRAAQAEPKELPAPVLSAKKKVTEQAPVVEQAAPAPARVKVEVESWIDEGWRQLESRGLEAACAQWETGLRSLGKSRPVLQIGIYTVAENAVSVLRRLWPEYPAFLVRGTHAGKKAYMLVVAPPAKEFEMSRDQIRAKLKVSSVLLRDSRSVTEWLEQPKTAARRPAGPITKKPAAAKPAPRRAAPPAPVERTPEPLPALKAFVPAPAPVATKPESSELLASARRAEEVGQMEEAQRLLSKLLAQHPADEEGRLMMARLLVQKGAYADAAALLQPMLQTGPGRWEASFWLGTAQLGQGNLALAENYLNQALAVESNAPQIWVQLAIVAQQRGNHTQALQLLGEAKRLNAQMPEVHLNIAFSQDSLGNISTAVYAYRMFLKLTEGKSLYVDQRREVLMRMARLGY
jgi:Tfp pilus assembly protein PilF